MEGTETGIDVEGSERMAFRDYVSSAIRVAAIAALATAGPAINTFGKDPEKQSWCTQDMLHAKAYVSAPLEQRRWMRAMCHRGSLIEPFRFAYDLTGFPSVE